jgi:hypothetical protein
MEALVDVMERFIRHGEPQQALMRRLVHETRRLVRRHRKDVEALAAALLKRRRIFRREAEGIIRRGVGLPAP